MSSMIEDPLRRTAIGRWHSRLADNVAPRRNHWRTKVVYYRSAASVCEICAGGQFAVENCSDAVEFSSQMALAIDTPFSCPTDLTQFRWETAAANVESLIRHLQQEQDVPKQSSDNPRAQG